MIDLVLSKYDQLSTRFQKEQVEVTDFLKSGIATRNAGFNRLIDRIEQVALRSQAVLAYGAPRRLLPEMEVEADVLLETRRLYEWAFEPLYALAGRVRS